MILLPILRPLQTAMRQKPTEIWHSVQDLTTSFHEWPWHLEEFLPKVASSLAVSTSAPQIQ